MDNYIEEDDNDYVSSPNFFRISGDKYKYIIIGICILIAIVILVLISRLTSNSKSYASYEDKMIKSAKEYVTQYNITTDKATYIDISKLDVNLPDSCSKVSGVICDGDSYTAYLMCKDYESKITQNAANIKLKGNPVIILLRGMTYYELGYSGYQQVVTSGNSISEVGVHDVNYFLGGTDKVTNRKVIIMDNPELTNYYPVINLTNPTTITLEKGKKYSETPTAYDSLDGDITKNIVSNVNVDVGKEGEYEAVYGVTNSLGFTTIVMQKVKVIDSNKTQPVVTPTPTPTASPTPTPTNTVDSTVSIKASLSEEKMTNKNVKIYLTITGDGYDYTELPDGKKTTETQISYEVSKNDTYKFTVVKKNTGKIIKTININNIDKTKFKGECKARVYNGKLAVTVRTTSKNVAVAYNYYIDGKATGYIAKNSYNVDKTDVSNVYVVGKDYVGNTGKVKCDIEVVSNSGPSCGSSNIDDTGFKTIIESRNHLTMPITQALAARGHTVADLNKCIADRVRAACPYTRYGVAAAGVALIDCSISMMGMVVPYDHVGGKVNYCEYNSSICGKLGVNVRWGERGGMGCGADTCLLGLNCATAVRWAMCNGGMDLCTKGSAGAHSMVSTEYFPEADGVQIIGDKVSYYSGTDYSGYDVGTLVRMLKPGDAIASSEGGGHAFIVAGKDDTGIYTAEDGYYMRHIKYSQLTNGKESYRLLFLDKYYANPANRNGLYD